jgi:pimeloyl-ACP methyl ester carboxylesterase
MALRESITQRAKRAILGAWAAGFPQFARLLPQQVPVPVLQYEAPGRPDQKQLLLLLPGIGDTAGCYARQGFLTVAQQGQRPTDVWAVDAHVGYYASRTFLDRLDQDVIGPARERGYRTITLAGISLGGFGALLYASRFPGTVEKVIALAPFLGRSAVVQEIGVSGLSAWTHSEIAANDYERSLWSWLKGYGTEGAGTLPRLYLGFGEEDCFVSAHRLLSAVLPDRQVFIAPGGHTWSTWRHLWGRLQEAEALDDGRPLINRQTVSGTISAADAPLSGRPLSDLSRTRE